MTFRIETKSSFQKNIKKIPKGVQIRLIEKIRCLAQNPRPQGSIQLKGDDKLFRIVVGDYRVIYKIDYHCSTVLIILVDNRKDVYRAF